MGFHWNHVFDQQNLLFKLFDAEVRDYLAKPENQEILKWLDDSLYLAHEVKTYKSVLGHPSLPYYDYSFIVTPAFKALEKWVLTIAPHLGVAEKLIEDAQNYGRFSTFLNDEAIEKIFKKVVKQLDIKAEAKKTLRSSMHALGSYLKNLRHTPAHCSATIESNEKAENIVRQIIGAINDLTANLLRDGILPRQ